MTPRRARDPRDPVILEDRVPEPPEMGRQPEPLPSEPPAAPGEPPTVRSVEPPADQGRRWWIVALTR